VVTPGKPRRITDGAARSLDDREARKPTEYPGIGRLVSGSVVGVDPAIMGIGPAFSIPKALERAGVGMRDLAVMEINEAFASQVLACLREMHADGVR